MSFKKLGSNGVLLALISTILFSAQFPLIKYSLAYLNSDQAAILEAVFTIIFCALWRLGTSSKIQIFFNKEILASGLLNAAGLILLFEGIARVHPGVVGLIGRLYFIYAMLIAYLYFKERAQKSEVVLIFLAILGVFLISFTNSQGSVGSSLGILMTIFYPAFFACQNAIIKSNAGKYSPPVVLFNTKLYALPPLVLYGFFNQGASMLNVSSVGVSIILISTFVSTFLGLVFFYRALALTTFARANLMKATEPVFVLLFSALFFPITFNFFNTLGTILIVISVFFVAIAQPVPAQTVKIRKNTSNE